MPSDLRNCSLKIIRKIVESENKMLTTAAVHWDTDDWTPFKLQIKERQDMLNELHVVKLLCRIISKEMKRSLLEEATLVAIAVLLGGNYDT